MTGGGPPAAGADVNGGIVDRVRQAVARLSGVPVRDTVARVAAGRRRTLLVVSGVALAAVLATGFLVWSPGGQRAPASPSVAAESPSAGASAAPGAEMEPPSDPSPTAPPAGANPSTSAPGLTPEQATQDAERSLRAYLKLADESYQRADGRADEIGQVATGFAEGEVVGAAAQRADEGLRQVGVVQVVGLSAVSVDLASAPPRVVLAACIDTSEVDVVDATGNSVRNRLQRKAVEHVYGVEMDGVGWKVSTHEIPSATECGNE